MRLSYSAISGFNKYKKEELCGLLFSAVYIDKTHQLPINQEAVNYGRWFENMATGYGEPIEPTRIKSGELNAQYRVLEKQLEHYKNIKNEFLGDEVYYGTEIIVEDSVVAKGIFDVLTPKLIADIKVTGNIDGRDEYGWGGDIRYKPHILQAKMYIWLYWKRSGDILPFYFMVFSNKSEGDIKLIKVTMSEDPLIAFEDELKLIDSEISYYENLGFEVHASLENCTECPLREGCSYKSNLPKEQVIAL